MKLWTLAGRRNEMLLKRCQFHILGWLMLKVSMVLSKEERGAKSLNPQTLSLGIVGLWVGHGETEKENILFFRK